MRIAEFLAAAVVVVVLGGLAGWYFFVNQQVAETEQIGTSRGFGIDLPFGETGASVRPPEGETVVSLGTTSAPRKAPRLWRMTPGPVAGFGFRTASTSIYFVERANGNIMLADPETSRVVRVTNTLLPKVYEADFTKNGTAILRTVAENGSIATFSGVSVATSSSSTGDAAVRALSGSYLPADIVSIATYGDTLYYVVRDPAGGAVVVSASARGTEQKKIRSMPLSQWHIDAANDGTLVLAQKPADNLAGYAYTLSKDGAITRIALGAGLAVNLKSAGGPLLYSTSGGGLALFAKANADAEPVRLALSTVADKCVWTRGSEPVAYCAVPLVNPGSGYMDRRAKGAVHTADQIWRIDAASGTADPFFSFPQGTGVDVARPAIDERSGTLVFMNTVDGSLWSLRLSAE